MSLYFQELNTYKGLCRVVGDMTIFLCSICQRTRDEQVMNKSRAAMSKPIRSYNRVPHNTVSIFVLLISWPPKHLEVPSLTFFNSPFHVDFKTIQFVIIDEVLNEIFPKYWKDVI